LRKVWPDEARDFTPWLAEGENIDLLSDAVGIDIAVDETESGVGDFNVDIYATDKDSGRKIVIENQLEDTNHDHLGKLITYAAGKSAEVIIWVVKHARDEHKAAIEWLNNHTDDKIGFFLCEVKLYKIGNSDPAVKFDVVEKPNDWIKVGKDPGPVTSTQQLRYEFWTAFLDCVGKDHAFMKAFKLRKPGYDHWLTFSVGSAACHLNILQVQKNSELDVELYVSDDKDLYRSLHSAKREIESECGFELDWRELPEKKASRIIAHKAGVNFEDRKQWPELFKWLSVTLLKMREAFGKRI